MKINFENKKVKRYFENFNYIKKEKGIEVAKQVKKRINQLAAAENFSEYLEIGLGRPHLLVGDLEGRYAIEINAHLRLIVRPITKNLDAETLVNCESIIIEGVMDYHGGKQEWLIP